MADKEKSSNMLVNELVDSDGEKSKSGKTRVEGAAQTLSLQYEMNLLC